jgi:hypothetical protein
VAPPGNQAATEKTNINLYHSENPVYSPNSVYDFKPFYEMIPNTKIGIENEIVEIQPM